MSNLGYGADSGRNGKDAEMHAINALLLTGPVGLGDTCIGKDCMTNGTLVRRLARADGILLRPDRPMAPMDAMFGSLLDGIDGVGGVAGGGKFTSMGELETGKRKMTPELHASASSRASPPSGASSPVPPPPAVSPRVRAMPGLCTLAQETQPDAESAHCGARLWQTHATVYPEDRSKVRATLNHIQCGEIFTLTPYVHYSSH